MRYVNRRARRVNVGCGGMTWLVLLCLWSGVAWGQISETRTDLHDGQQVYGLEVYTTSPWYTNALDIWLWAEGRTEPNYANVSFHAYGLYGDVNLIIDGICHLPLF